MDQSKDTTFHQKGKHFSKTDRRELQGILRTAKLLGQSLSLRKLAKLMHCAPNTIRNELKRGAHPHTGHYGAQTVRCQPLCNLGHTEGETVPLVVRCLCRLCPAAFFVSQRTNGLYQNPV